MQAILPPYQPVVVRQSQGSVTYSQQSCCTILLCRTQATLLLVCGLNCLATLTPSATSRINYHVLANRPQSSTHAINSYLATAFLVILSVTHHCLECVHLLHTRLAHHTHMLKGLSYLLHLLSRPLPRCRPRCTRKAAACAAPPPPHPLPFGLSF